MFEFIGRLTTANEMNALNRSHKQAGARRRKQELGDVCLQLRPQINDMPINVFPFHYRVEITILWLIDTLSDYDADNVAYAKKALIDGLVKEGVLISDKLHRIGRLVDEFQEHDCDGAIIVIRPMRFNEIVHDGGTAVIRPMGESDG